MVQISHVASHVDNDIILPFIQAPSETPKEKNDSKCIRFLRKKHQCLIIYCLLSIVFLQTCTLIVSKLDDESFNNILKYFTNFVHKNATIINNCNCTE